MARARDCISILRGMREVQALDISFLLSATTALGRLPPPGHLFPHTPALELELRQPYLPIHNECKTPGFHHICDPTFIPFFFLEVLPFLTNVGVNSTLVKLFTRCAANLQLHLKEKLGWINPAASSEWPQCTYVAADTWRNGCCRESRTKQPSSLPISAF